MRTFTQILLTRAMNAHPTRNRRRHRGLGFALVAAKWPQNPREFLDVGNRIDVSGNTRVVAASAGEGNQARTNRSLALAAAQVKRAGFAFPVLVSGIRRWPPHRRLLASR